MRDNTISVKQRPLPLLQQGTKSHLDALVEFLPMVTHEIQDLYRCSALPWVIGFSGGKDSTMVTQLVYNALRQLPEAERLYPVYILAGDTKVEDPAMALRIQLSIRRINAAAQQHTMPVSGHIVVPPVEQTFFVLLIGRGYPAPSSHFRWCTARLKIDPASTFIEERVSQFGEVILVLGARKSESTTRAQTLKAYEIPHSVLRRHSTLPNAYVYAPIADLPTQSVWDYLMNTVSPWGDNNRNLRALYKQSEGECPLVVDTSTPTCGGSRFGCWVCTVSQYNKSLENRCYDEGEEWLQPLLDFRALLKQTIDPAHKLEYRDVRQRRTNRINLTRKGDVSPRSYSLDTRKMLLRLLLEAQIQVQREGPDPNLALITQEEFQEIRRIWMTEDGDWEDSVQSIYREVTGDKTRWPRMDTLLTLRSLKKGKEPGNEVCDGRVPWFGPFGAQLKRILQERASEIPFELIAQLLENERIHLDTPEGS
jgi:DNA sulfur modification protein DndC